jgi:hypothetical protein
VVPDDCVSEFPLRSNLQVILVMIGVSLSRRVVIILYPVTVFKDDLLGQVQLVVSYAVYMLVYVFSHVAVLIIAILRAFINFNLYKSFVLAKLQGFIICLLALCGETRKGLKLYDWRRGKEEMRIRGRKLYAAQFH